MAVGDAYVFPGFLTPVLTLIFFPKPPTTFPTCFCRGERRKYVRKKSRLNRGSKSQPPGHEPDTLTAEPPGRGEREKEREREREREREEREREREREQREEREKEREREREREREERERERERERRKRREREGKRILIKNEGNRNARKCKSAED